MICSCTAWRWLYKLGYEYKDICKDVFVNKHKKLDIIKVCKNFFTKIEELKPYMVEFEEDNIMKPKAYFSDCVVRGDER